MAIIEAAIRPSLLLFFVLMTSHLATSIVLLSTNLPVEIQALLQAMIFGSFAYYFARDCRLCLPGSWTSLSLDNDVVSVKRLDRGVVEGLITPKTVITSYCIVLGIEKKGNVSTSFRVFFPDALAVGLFREMCVLLRMR